MVLYSEISSLNDINSHSAPQGKGDNIPPASVRSDVRLGVEESSGMVLLMLVDTSKEPHSLHTFNTKAFHLSTDLHQQYSS